MNRLRITRAVPTACILAMLSAAAEPRASAAPDSWALDFEFHDPQPMTLQFPGEQRSTSYWYLLFQVTNNTGREVDFYPSFRLVTDTLRVVEGGADVPPGVYDAIAARHGSQYPFLLPPWKITGPVLQGTENARTSAAVFKAIDKNARSFTIYIGGLSGETVRVPNPSISPQMTGKGEVEPYFVLRRTLAIQYDLPGDAESRHLTRPARRGREWVMR